MVERLPPPASLARRHFMKSLPLARDDSRLSQLHRLYLEANVRMQWVAFLISFQCFGLGTLIRTDHGEVPVEDLAIGDTVMTSNGAMPVKFVGRRTLRRSASASWHPAVLPIRVAKFAIDEQTPSRDLYLSQRHCLLIDGVLIQVDQLVNGQSIVVDHDAMASETIEYFCVELDTHQVIFAEGLAAETFEYGGGQISWDNLGDYEELYGKHKVIPACAPICHYTGGRAEVRALLRLVTSRVRDPIQVAYARIAARARIAA